MASLKADLKVSLLAAYLAVSTVDKSVALKVFLMVGDLAGLKAES